MHEEKIIELLESAGKIDVRDETFQSRLEQEISRQARAGYAPAGLLAGRTWLIPAAGMAALLALVVVINAGHDPSSETPQPDGPLAMNSERTDSLQPESTPEPNQSVVVPGSDPKTTADAPVSSEPKVAPSAPVGGKDPQQGLGAKGGASSSDEPAAASPSGPHVINLSGVVDLDDTQNVYFAGDRMRLIIFFDPALKGQESVQNFERYFQSALVSEIPFPESGVPGGTVPRAVSFDPANKPRITFVEYKDGFLRGTARTHLSELYYQTPNDGSCGDINRECPATVAVSIDVVINFDIKLVTERAISNTVSAFN